MPVQRFVILILAVLVAAGVTVWLFTLGGPEVMVVAIPALLIVALAVRALRK